MMRYVSDYQEIIAAISEATGLTDPVLHFHAGMAVFLVARMLTGRSLGSFIPFLFVMLVEGANEAMDYLSHGFQLADSTSDALNTLGWPFLLSLGVRLRAPKPEKRTSSALS